MKVLVFGAGALGSFVGGLLSKSNDVTLIGRRKHVEAINSHGLKIEGKTNTIARPRASETVPDEYFDLIVVTVKSYDTQKFVESVPESFKGNSVVLSLQNGIGNVERISTSFSRVLGGTTSHGIIFVGPGRVKHTGFGDTTIGNFREVEPEEVREIAKSFSDAGIETRTSDNISGEIWAKAIINASINPLTAVTRLENGYLLKMKDLRDIMVGACGEATEVALSAKVELPCLDITEKAIKIATMTADNKSSMLQDIERGKRTEIESITGEFVNIARRNRIDIPVNSLLYALVKSMEYSPSGHKQRNK